TPFPYTTLFRSSAPTLADVELAEDEVDQRPVGQAECNVQGLDGVAKNSAARSQCTAAREDKAAQPADGSEEIRNYGFVRKRDFDPRHTVPDAWQRGHVGQEI